MNYIGQFVAYATITSTTVVAHHGLPIQVTHQVTDGAVFFFFTSPLMGLGCVSVQPWVCGPDNKLLTHMMF